MRWWSPSANLFRVCLLTCVTAGEILAIVGCNAAPFHAVTQKSGSSFSLLKDKEAESAKIDGSGWPGSARYTGPDSKAQYHEVRAGETLPRLAKMYGLSVSQLSNANSLDADEGLKPGQILKIPRAP